MMEEILGNVIAWIFNLLPSGNLTGLTAAIDGIVKYLKAALYFLPVKTMASILSVILLYWTYRLIIKIIKLVWDVVPFL